MTEPKISQATIAQMIRAFRVLMVRPDPRTLPIVGDVQLELYEVGVPQDLLQEFANLNWNFQRILPQLHAGTLGLDSGVSGLSEAFVDEVPYWRDRGTAQKILVAIATYLCNRISPIPDFMPVVKNIGQVLIRRLEMDGFAFQNGRLVPTDSMPRDVVAASDAFTRLLRDSSLPNRELIERHYRQGAELYEASQPEPAIGEWRKFYEQILRDIANDTAKHRPDVKTSVGTMKDVLDYLRTVGFFDAEERLAYGNTYGLLSSGTKPGILASDLAQTSMVQSVSNATLLLKKFRSWRTNGFRF